MKPVPIDLRDGAMIVAGSTRGRGRNLAIDGSAVITDGS